MHIGLVGGVGVAATVVYYQRLTAAVAAMDGPPLDLTISHGDIQTLIRNVQAGAKRPQAEVFVAQVVRLKAAGADVAAVTSLGGHFCFDELAAISPLPLVSAVTPVDTALAARGIRRVGLLGTRVVMDSRLYGQLKATVPVVLDDEIEELGQTYQDIAVAGHCTTGQRSALVDAGQRMIDELGADAVLLAGTDLNLAFDDADPGYTVIDALDVHVDVLARLATGRLALDAVAVGGGL